MNAPHIKILLVLAAPLAGVGLQTQAGDTNSYATAVLRLKSGREIECQVISREGTAVRIQRPFGHGFAKESYQVGQIAGLYFPRPAILDSGTQDIAALEAEYARWQPFADIKGNWAAAVGVRLAHVLEGTGLYARAMELYDAHADAASLPGIVRTARVRGAICAARLGASSNVLARLTNAWTLAAGDCERAELTYHIGRAEAACGNPVDGLFALLRNVVFYSAHHEWEPKSLAAALPLYARLDRDAEYHATIDALLRRFPGTAYADYATNCLARLTTVSNLAELADFTMQPHGAN